MTDDAAVTDTDSDALYYVRYTVWEKSDDACEGRGAHTGDEESFEGVFDEPSPIDCVNAIVYDLRGTKSRWELAYVEEITPVSEREADADA